MARLEPRARAMLRAYREAKTSPPQSDDALWDRIEASLDHGAPGLSVEASPRPRPVWVAPVAALAVAAAAIAAIGLGASLGRPDPSTRAPVQAPHHAAPHRSAPVASPSKAAATTARPEPPPAPAVDLPPPPNEPRPRAAPGPNHRSPSFVAPATLEPAGSDAAADTLLLETALIQRARRALRAAAPERALEVLDEHARDFPRGQMREDRGVLRIEALCAAGKGPQARAEARQFRRSFPGSAHASRVRDLCPAR